LPLSEVPSAGETSIQREQPVSKRCWVGFGILAITYGKRDLNTYPASLSARAIRGFLLVGSRLNTRSVRGLIRKESSTETVTSTRPERAGWNRYQAGLGML